MNMDGRLVRPIIIGSAVALLILGTVWKIADAKRGLQLEEERASVVKGAGLLRARLEAAINSHVYLTEGLRAHVALHPDIGLREFRAIARQLMTGHPVIRAIQLARNNVVSHIYPLKGNEAVQGLDLFSIPGQREAVWRTLEIGGTVIAGPVELIQGGIAFISRTPIYLPPRQGEAQGKYWGLATVLLDEERLFQAAGLDVPPEDLRIALRGKDGLAQQGEIFYGDAAIFASRPVTAAVSLPNGGWQLAAIPHSGWGGTVDSQETLLIGGILFALAGGLVSGMLVLRTRELVRANRSLDAARAKAMRAAKDRSRFLAAASHDLRQPLHALSIFISELEERARLHQWNFDLVEKIRNSADALNELFHGLMDISRLDAGAVKPNISEVPLHSILERLAVENAPAAMAKGLRLRVVATRVVVRSDPILLECLLRNLLVNAIKYTDSGGVLIGCRREEERLRIEIWDSGNGIPISEKKRIFEEFYQLGNPEQDSRKGLGLGLAIVQRMSMLLGHHLEMRSWQGRGSVFSVSLPRCFSPQHAAPRKIVPHGYTLRDVTVLVVDNDEIVLDATRRLLEHWGCGVWTARTGEEAVAGVKNAGGGLDIALCDYHLSDAESGGDVIRRVRALVGSDMPACLITGDTTDAVLEICEELGCRLLAKPLAPAKLRAVLRGVVQKKTAKVEVEA